MKTITLKRWWNPEAVILAKAAFSKIIWTRIYAEDVLEKRELISACYEMVGFEEDLIELLTLTERTSLEEIFRELNVAQQIIPIGS